MNIALPVLLLVFGGLTFWLLTESQLKWYLKAACISVFCIFTIIFWSSIHTFLGWGAEQKSLPEKILVHWVIIKEPNKFLHFDGVIYILAESAQEEKINKYLKIFSYKNETLEPRLYKLKYGRQLHEELEKIKLRLKKGQAVVGTLMKPPSNDKGKGKKGDGSESQEQEWHFHELLPSEIHQKPEE